VKPDKAQQVLLDAYLKGAADPEAVSVGLERMLDAGADLSCNLGGWLKLIDVSPAAVETIVTRPSLAVEIPRDKGTRELDLFTRELDVSLRALPDLEARLEHLRAVRVDETLRIAWQDVVEGADLTVVTRRISDLAEIMTGRLLRMLEDELAGRFGRPWHGTEPVTGAVIAMGKLGGAELNYSSDIDLIFLYGKDGETDGGKGGKRISNREYFHRLAERFTRAANAVTPQGRLYRVDLRLRPEGASGSLARSLASSIAYYRRMGETWERQALLKARVIAGDRDLGGEFVRSVREWAHARGLDFSEIATIKRLKQRMEDITAGRGEERSEVKLGYGGIRDVEYVIQFLQLLHGSRTPGVRHHNSLTALRRLERAGAIVAEERDVLDGAYRFLRLVEHRLQLVQGTQVHRVPDDEGGMYALARRCGYDSAADFSAAYREHAEAVRTVFNRLFRHLFKERDKEQAAEIDLALADSDADAGLAAVLERHGIRDIERGIATLHEMHRATSALLADAPRVRKFFANLLPDLLDAVARTPDPDAALERIERISGRVGARATLYAALSADTELLRLLVDLAGSSEFMTNILVRAPGALDQLVDAMQTAPDRGLTSFEDIPVASVPTAPDAPRILADYKNLELLRIGIRDVRGEHGVRAVAEELTQLAEVIVRLAYERARLEAQASGPGLVVVALGKFGSREMLYGSDLDLVFFARDRAELDKASAVARRLSALLGTPTDFGRLYAVDHRLRPGGQGGPLVTTPAAFADYFSRGIGQTWERMAYTRARPVAGPPTLCEEIGTAIADTVYAGGFNANDARAMARMREKLAVAGGDESIKRARAGGVVDIEFVVQMYALRHGLRAGSTAGRLEALRDAGHIEPQRAADLLCAYRFLLSLESRIRIVTDLPEDRLPDDPQALRALAARLGYVGSGALTAEGALREEYEYHQDIAARAFHAALENAGA